MKKFELRYQGAFNIEDDRRRVHGYAAVYETLSKDLGGFREIIKRRAFDPALNRSPDVIATINHDQNLVLGRRGANLQIGADPVGLYFDLEIPETSYGNDLLVNLRAGAMKSCSFAFVVERDNWVVDDGVIRREILEIGEIRDISIVTTPAYEDTSVAIRSLKSHLSMETAKRYEILKARGII